MAAISQKYNTYLQGMSDQPDEIMKPGQLKGLTEHISGRYLWTS